MSAIDRWDPQRRDWEAEKRQNSLDRSGLGELKLKLFLDLYNSLTLTHTQHGSRSKAGLLPRPNKQTSTTSLIEHIGLWNYSGFHMIFHKVSKVTFMVKFLIIGFIMTKQNQKYLTWPTRMKANNFYLMTFLFRIINNIFSFFYWIQESSSQVYEINGNKQHKAFKWN